MLDGHMRVVDHSFGIGDGGVAGDAEGYRSLIHPVWAGVKPISLDPPIKEGEDAVDRTEHAHAMHRASEGVILTV
jgi:hypothetical protein